jgi:hypothetical protein
LYAGLKTAAIVGFDVEERVFLAFKNAASALPKLGSEISAPAMHNCGTALSFVESTTTNCGA